MTKLTRAAKIVKFNDSSAGLYKDAQSIPISRLRTEIQDDADSTIWPEDFYQVRCMSAANIPDYDFDEDLGNITATANGALTLDGVAVDADDIVIINLESATVNGIYTVTDPGSAGSPFILDAVIPIGTAATFEYLVYILEGDTYAGKIVGKSGGNSTSSDTEVTLPIASSFILNAFSVPIGLIAAPGAGKGLIPKSIIITVDYNSAPYATNTTIEFYVGSTPLTGGLLVDVLTQTSDKIFYVSIPSFTTEINQPLTMAVLVGNPTAGNSPLDIKIEYETITV